MSSQAVSAPSALSGTLGEMIGEFFGTDDPDSLR